MTKIEFKDLLHRFANSTRHEADQVLLLKREYPYSQLLHSLAARVSKDHSLENHQQELQLAAVYAADRHVLKELMSKSFVPPANEDLVVTEVSLTTVTTQIEAVDYAEEVVHDLEILNDLKHNFELLYTDATAKPIERVKKESTPLHREIDQRKAITKEKPHKKATPAKKTAGAKKKVVAKSKVKPAAKKKVVKPSVKASKGKPKASKGKLKKAKPLKKKLKNGDELLLEITSSKRELRIDNPKQREQIELIDNFIKTQPSISNARDKSALQVPPGDLSALKQGEFSDQIISETLVSILVSQGKKEKAVEVLKKLIWKFPQKKAYFAAQIEELKK